MLESQIQSTGLRRAVLYHDLSCAVNRVNLHQTQGEVDLLEPDQLIMYLGAAAIEPGCPLWQVIEARVGHPLTP